MTIFGELLYFLLEVYVFIIIAGVIVSWLLAFGVLNLSNPQAANLVRLLNKAIDPVMRPVQKFVPSLGGIDISPIIVIFGIMLLQRLVVEILIRPFAMH